MKLARLEHEGGCRRTEARSRSGRPTATSCSSRRATSSRWSPWTANPVGRDRVLLTVPKFQDLQYDPATPDYGVMPDGQHFVFGLSPQPAETIYNVVLNWFEELKQKRSSR